MSLRVCRDHEQPLVDAHVPLHQLAAAQVVLRVRGKGRDGGPQRAKVLERELDVLVLSLRLARLACAVVPGAIDAVPQDVGIRGRNAGGGWGGAIESCTIFQYCGSAIARCSTTSRMCQVPGAGRYVCCEGVSPASSFASQLSVMARCANRCWRSTGVIGAASAGRARMAAAINANNVRMGGLRSNHGRCARSGQGRSSHRRTVRHMKPLPSRCACLA